MQYDYKQLTDLSFTSLRICAILIVCASVRPQACNPKKQCATVQHFPKFPL